MKNLTILIFFLFSLDSFCQLGLSNQYQFNYLSTNPAFAGENGSFSIKGVLGNQFNGTIRPNQVSQMVVIDGQLYNNTGLAFQGFRTNSGNLISTGFGFSYSKGMELGEAKLKFGLQSGLIVQPNLLTVQGSQRLSPHAGAGLLISFKDFFLGFSKPMVVASKKIVEPKPFFANIGYIFDNESLLSFNINGMYSQDFAFNRSNTDLNLKMWYNKRIALGASFRNGNLNLLDKNITAIYPFAEYKINTGMILGLGYDNNTASFTSQFPNPLSVPGVFQLFFKYTSGGDKENYSWFYNNF
jgi:type IX secretion system PorP/SprF family membrane protein